MTKEEFDLIRVGDHVQCPWDGPTLKVGVVAGVGHQTIRVQFVNGEDLYFRLVFPYKNVTFIPKKLVSML
jgi:hypothetical protein